MYVNRIQLLSLNHAQALEEEGLIEGDLLQVIVSAALSAVPCRVAHLEQHDPLLIFLRHRCAQGVKDGPSIDHR